ncbi:MAG TPA: hypothetical protein VN420_05640 [Candidatus Fimivivens sp.]|nr:hypothetical protein [Candidatus Fimivivens sp.]
MEITDGQERFWQGIKEDPLKALYATICTLLPLAVFDGSGVKSMGPADLLVTVWISLFALLLAVVGWCFMVELSFIIAKLLIIRIQAILSSTRTPPQ